MMLIKAQSSHQAQTNMWQKLHPEEVRDITMYMSFQVLQYLLYRHCSIVAVDQTINSNFPPFLQPQPYHHLLRNKMYLLTPGLKG